VTPADTPTLNGGLVGTVTSKGYRYLFGAGQGPLRWDGVRIRGPNARADYANARGWGWVIVAPDSVAIEELEWSLTSPDGTRFWEAAGLEPRKP
jgi:hypothetical protein